MNNTDNLTVENLDGEIWKDIEGYEGYYQVSNLGRVKSLDRQIHMKNGKNMLVSGTIMALQINQGYLTVRLRLGNTRKNVRVHRLVATAFIPNPNNLPEVNHIDENKQNNSVDNLEWCTHKYNSNFGTKNIRSNITKSKNPNLREICKSNGMKIAKKVICTTTGEIYESIRCAARSTGLDRSCIYRVCSGKLKSTHGYVFMYFSDYENIK